MLTWRQSVKLMVASKAEHAKPTGLHCLITVRSSSVTIYMSHLNVNTVFLGSKQDVNIMISCTVNDFMEFFFKTNFLITSF